MNGKTIQIKTVEKLIIQELYNSESSDHRVHTAFARVLDHFSDEDYLHKIGHQRIITTIYINHFYKYKKSQLSGKDILQVSLSAWKAAFFCNIKIYFNGGKNYDTEKQTYAFAWHSLAVCGAYIWSVRR